MALAPLDDTITIDALTLDPYPIYARLRRESPVLRVKSVGRTFLTKAIDTKAVKDDPELYSSNDPYTPMERAFRAHTLMRKDGAEHARERGAMAPAFSARNIRDVWMPIYEKIAHEYVDALPKGETVEFFGDLAGPFAAQCLSHLLGIPNATDDDMQRWSQTLIDGAGNFGWRDDLFANCETVNDEIDAELLAMDAFHKSEQGPSALSVMLNADDPLPLSQIRSNIKIAIGGGINEPRDALMTVLYGLLSNPEQQREVVENQRWNDAFEEAIRWVAPIQVSSRLVMTDTQIRGLDIPKGDTVMTIQASANHDEDFVTDGHLYNVFRDKNQHQSFGNGPHFCQGTHVARRQIGQVMLPILFERFPNMQLAGDVPFRGFGFRGPVSLPIRLS
ncbi:cytochrome P450 [Amylibacter ulvae]|uniref:Cytochrome P450 n=1 Tax=Paramylibacter ulvae TaxID=1651968 RepID=A0ABQ3D2Q9_9RHOB|nr:cytochrome P450 [Amylibacter ulvae]GHA55736.1 cytochrome P450 [Amylibacter ulvae]